MLKVIDLLSDSGSFLPWHMVKVKYQLCKLENETVSHLFCNRTFTQHLWKKLQAWVRGYLILPASEPSIVILGVSNTKNENNVLVNHVVLLFKYFIYKNRTNKHAINIHALKNYKFLQKIEQRIARKKDRLEKHFTK